MKIIKETLLEDNMVELEIELDEGEEKVYNDLMKEYGFNDLSELFEEAIKNTVARVKEEQDGMGESEMPEGTQDKQDSPTRN
jgi:hypothetical protein